MPRPSWRRSAATPSVGIEADRGTTAIRSFWFPDDGSKTTVTSYRTEIADARTIDGAGWLYGTGDLSLAWEKGGERTSVRQTSTFTMIATREPDGQWRIVHPMWTGTNP